MTLTLNSICNGPSLCNQVQGLSSREFLLAFTTPCGFEDLFFDMTTTAPVQAGSDLVLQARGPHDVAASTSKPFQCARERIRYSLSSMRF